MTVSRLLRWPIIIVTRTAGAEDSWGSPTYTETETDAHCYFQQVEAADTDSLGETDPPSATYEVFLEPDVIVDSYDAVKLDVGLGVEELEVVGPPSAALNARLAETNHLKLTVRRALP